MQPNSCAGCRYEALARASLSRRRPRAALRADRRFEVFAFGTRLTRLTSALDTRRPDEALSRAASTVADWDGGTRIGASLRTFLESFGHAGLARGAVVVVCSDGLEVGDPALVAEQMRRLQRLAHRVVWLNPLKASPEYEPLARAWPRRCRTSTSSRPVTTSQASKRSPMSSRGARNDTDARVYFPTQRPARKIAFEVARKYCPSGLNGRSHLSRGRA